MQNSMRYASSIFAIVALTVTSTVLAIDSTAECLSHSEQLSLADRNAATLQQFGFDDLQVKFGEWTALMKESFAARNEITECEAENRRGLAGALGISVCNDLIREYNKIIARANSVKSYIDQQQGIIDAMLRMNRLRYRSCN